MQIIPTIRSVSGVNYLFMLKLFLLFFHNIFLSLLEKTMQAAWLLKIPHTISCIPLPRLMYYSHKVIAVSRQQNKSSGGGSGLALQGVKGHTPQQHCRVPKK